MALLKTQLDQDTEEMASLCCRKDNDEELLVSALRHADICNQTMCNKLERLTSMEEENTILKRDLQKVKSENLSLRERLQKAEKDVQVKTCRIYQLIQDVEFRNNCIKNMEVVVEKKREVYAEAVIELSAHKHRNDSAGSVTLERFFSCPTSIDEM